MSTEKLVPARRLTLFPIPYFLFPVLAVLPLLFTGPSCGHDFDFHILSWFEAAQQLLHGHYPAWAYTPAWNAGEPRFVFYPPLSWLTGAVLGWVLPWHFVPIAYTWLALTLSGFTMHRLARRYVTESVANLAAIVYIMNPYMLFTAYERTAYGELLAAAWIPLLLTAILAPRANTLAIALPVGLLWITNAPAAVMGCYSLAILAVIRLAGLLKQRDGESRSFTLKTTAGVLLGLALAAFYVLPAAYERPEVQTAMATVQGMRIVDNTLFHHTTDPDHDVVLHTASMLAVLLLATTVATLLLLKHRLRIPLAILAAILAFLLTPWSLAIWHHAPELTFLQFPWRFLAILAAVMSFALGLAFRDRELSAWTSTLLAIFLAVGLIVPAWRIFRQVCDTPDTVEARLALFHSPLGTDPTDEYTPAAADNDVLRHTNPPYWLSMNPDSPAPAASDPAGLPDRFSVDVPTAETLILNRRDFPGWRITLNGKPATLDPPGTRDDGLIALPVPAGHDTVELSLHRGPDQTAGIILSGAALMAAFAIRRRPV